MLRSLYVLLLHLHPAVFRERFGDEMLEIAANTVGIRAKALLIADGVISLVRQWTLRSEFRRPLLATAIPDGPTGVPQFLTFESYQPPRSALLNGAILTIATFCAVAMALGHGGKARWYIIGTHHPSPHLIPVDRESVEETDLDTTVTIPVDPEDTWRALAGPYFRLMRVLNVLDADKDLVISPREMRAAPAALSRLDSGHDGKLDAEECGFSLGDNANVPPEIALRVRGIFMRENPVLAALDANRDGEISATEITAGSLALKTLDRNRDGSLTPDELLPDQIATQAAMIMMRIDTNDDGNISAAEQSAENAGPLQDLLESTDQNHDRVITRQELSSELQLRMERRQLDSAGRAGSFR